MRCKLRYVDVCNPAVVTVIILCGLYGEDKDINSRQQIINLRSRGNHFNLKKGGSHEQQ